MKKVLFIAMCTLFLGSFFSSCTPDDVCKDCYWKKVDNTTTQVVDQGTPTEYCGTALDAIQLEAPVTVGNYTTSWVCN